MHPCIEVLMIYKRAPFGEGSCHLKVSSLSTKTIQNFESANPRPHIILPHVEAQLKLSAPKIGHLAANSVHLGQSLLVQSLVQHPLFKFAIEDEALGVALCKVLWNQPVLLFEHHRITCQFKPTDKSSLGLPLVAMQDQVSESVDCTELIDVASRDPQHLIDTSLFAQIEHLLQRFLQLPSRQQLHMHSMHASCSVSSTFVQIDSVPVLVL